MSRHYILAVIATFVFILTSCGGGSGGNSGESESHPAPGESESHPAPTVTISVNPTSITSGQSATLTWSSTAATACTASGAWSGDKPVSGSQGVIPSEAGTATYTLTCTGTGGTATSSAILTVNAVPISKSGSIPVFVGTVPPVTGSSGALVLNEAPQNKKTFQWLSTDSILGEINSSVVTATEWNYIAGNPARVVFVGSGGGATFYGDVLLEPDFQAVVDIVKSVEGQTKQLRYLLKLARVDLDVDTNRDGHVDVNDNMNKDQFTPERGAVLLVNLDDDDGDKNSDANNNIIDTGGDIGDITELDIQKSGLDKIPVGFEYVLRLDKEIAGRRVRIFDAITAAKAEVLGPGAGVVSGNFKEFVIPAASLEGTGTQVYGIEGITYLQKDSMAPTDPAKNFNGLVDAELVLRKVTTKEVVFTDKVRLRASPWLMLGHLFDNQEVFVVTHGPDDTFVADLKKAITRIGGVNLTEVDGTTVKNDQGEQDIWIQDEIEIGFNKSPTSEMHSVLDGPRDRGLDGFAKRDLLNKGTAVFSIPLAIPKDDPGYSLNSLGNVEVTPRLTAEGKEWLLGRIYYGKKTGDREPQRNLIEFLEAQEIQGPVPLDSTWLMVGHVDEFISFVPAPNAGAGDKEFKVLLASPKRAIEILEADSAAGNGGTPIPKLGQTVDQVITSYKDQNVNNWQPKINAVKAEMKTKFGLADADFIDVPVLFDQAFGDGAFRAVGLLPNLENLLVVNANLISPEPFYDPFKTEFEDKLATIGYRRSSEANPTIYFIDDFDKYHSGNGEIHCGTNSRRKIPAMPNWWEQQ